MSDSVCSVDFTKQKQKKVKGGKARIKERERTSNTGDTEMGFSCCKQHYVLNSPVKYQRVKGKQKLKFKTRLKHTP